MPVHRRAEAAPARVAAPRAGVTEAARKAGLAGARPARPVSAALRDAAALPGRDWGGVIQAEDFPFIARRGFDHVRIPIRFSGHALAAAPYTIDAAFFSRVDTVLSQAAAANLAVVVDMHAYDELAADVAANRDRF